MIQPDGKLVAAGYGSNGHQFALARYTANGARDPSFGFNGVVRTLIGQGGRTLASAGLLTRGASCRRSRRLPRRNRFMSIYGQLTCAAGASNVLSVRIVAIVVLAAVTGLMALSAPVDAPAATSYACPPRLVTFVHRLVDIDSKIPEPYGAIQVNFVGYRALYLKAKLASTRMPKLTRGCSLSVYARANRALNYYGKAYDVWAYCITPANLGTCTTAGPEDEQQHADWRNAHANVQRAVRNLDNY